MTKNPITFTVNSCVPGYRGQLELKSNEGKDNKPFIYLRDIVDEFCLKLGREVSELKWYIYITLAISKIAQEKQSMLVMRTFSIDYNHHQSKKGKTKRTIQSVQTEMKSKMKNKKQFKIAPRDLKSI